MEENKDDDKEDLIVTQNLGDSLIRVKEMVKILYNRSNLSFETVEKLANVAKFKLRQVSEEPKTTDLAFTSLEEVADFLINKIL